MGNSFSHGNSIIFPVNMGGNNQPRCFCPFVTYRGHQRVVFHTANGLCFNSFNWVRVSVAFRCGANQFPFSLEGSSYSSSLFTSFNGHPIRWVYGESVFYRSFIFRVSSRVERGKALRLERVRVKVLSQGSVPKRNLYASFVWVKSDQFRFYYRFVRCFQVQIYLCYSSIVGAYITSSDVWEFPVNGFVSVK